MPHAIIHSLLLKSIYRQAAIMGMSKYELATFKKQIHSNPPKRALGSDSGAGKVTGRPWLLRTVFKMTRLDVQWWFCVVIITAIKEGSKPISLEW